MKKRDCGGWTRTAIPCRRSTWQYRQCDDSLQPARRHLFPEDLQSGAGPGSGLLQQTRYQRTVPQTLQVPHQPGLSRPKPRSGEIFKGIMSVVLPEWRITAVTPLLFRMGEKDPLEAPEVYRAKDRPEKISDNLKKYLQSVTRVRPIQQES